MPDQDFRSTPSYLQLLTGLSGALLVSIIAYYEREAVFRVITNPGANLIEVGALVIVFALGILSLVVGISYPIIQVTPDKFIFKRPLLFYSRVINRSDITQSRETVFLINPTYQEREVEIFHSRRLVLELKGKTQISLSSLQIPEYTQIRFILRGGRVAQELTTRLKVQRRRLAWVGMGLFVALTSLCFWLFVI